MNFILSFTITSQLNADYGKWPFLFTTRLPGSLSAANVVLSEIYRYYDKKVNYIGDKCYSAIFT